MRALVHHGSGQGQVELRDVGEPSAGPQDVLIEVAAVGVCGSDVHQWQGMHSWTVEYPIVLGHEYAGTVLDPGTSSLREGQRVTGETAAVIDPDSPMTRRGLYNLDPCRRGYGALENGAMRPRMAVPSRIVHPLPDAVSFETASLTEPCCVAYNAAVVNSPVRPGDRVVVLGPGPIGLLCAALARQAGGIVAVAGLPRDAARLAVADAYGCAGVTGDEVMDFARSGDGLGADVVIDAAGVSASLVTAMQIVRPAGWITKVGWGGSPLNASLDPLVQKNATLRGSFSHNWPIWERVIELLASGRLDVAPLIGGTWALEDWEPAFEAMHSGEVVKAVVRP